VSRAVTIRMPRHVRPDSGCATERDPVEARHITSRRMRSYFFWRGLLERAGAVAVFLEPETREREVRTQQLAVADSSSTTSTRRWKS